MQKSTVYFADFRSSDSENLQQKFARLLKTAGLAKLGLDGKYVAIKTHFGEPGCLAARTPSTTSPPPTRTASPRSPPAAT